METYFLHKNVLAPNFTAAYKVRDYDTRNLQSKASTTIWQSGTLWTAELAILDVFALKSGALPPIHLTSQTTRVKMRRKMPPPDCIFSNSQDGTLASSWFLRKVLSRAELWTFRRQGSLGASRTTSLARPTPSLELSEMNLCGGEQRCHTPLHNPRTIWIPGCGTWRQRENADDRVSA